MNSLLLLLFLVVSAVALYFLIGKAAKPSVQQVEGHLYHKLLQKSLGDRAQAERLIELERRQHPTISRARLIRYVLERWERDNRYQQIFYPALSRKSR